MPTKRMLVDAIHPEETRIVVTSGSRLEEFDFESASRRQLRGNIYLAKVTRVEPSLQAAFIEYGGNRHGFLAFSEIHPDYYQIPVADREALLRDQEADEAAEEAAHAEEDHAEETGSRNVAADAPIDVVSEHAEAPTEAEADADPQSTEMEGDEAGERVTNHVEEAPVSSEPIESIGGGDALEEMPERRKPSIRRNQYKIQEVIKRRQVMLVQVVKEERGNKGAALTTYLSLAGRYSVLMPNTARGGGISRKITNAADRKRLKDIVGDLDVPQGQGIILRTAGASRTKAEVKRDFEYLQRLWENVRTLTLKSVAPCLVYEEGSLIKRTIRDLYSKEIDELLVAGDDAYREAKDFMRMIMPSHAKNVQLYRDDAPLFSKFAVENQLDSMFSPQVTLPSGGYIVINPTEALVSIDVNSGRSTREHNIEDTALQTNLEAAEEVARQLRLRDLAGLIVIDFIDMMENRSNRAVERKLKDCLKNDRARIQVGRISHFGLMEMSRQRIRFGVVESSTHKCPTCQGTGLVRSVESLALMVMRAVEDHVLRKPGQSINLKVPTDVALYILNTKRGTLAGLEAKYSLSVTVVADDHVGPAHYQIERGEPRLVDPREQQAATHVRVDTAAMEEAPEPEVEETEDEDDEEESVVEAPRTEARDDGDRSGRRRRRRGRGRDREDRPAQQPAQQISAETAGEGEDEDDVGGETPVQGAAPQDGARDENGDSRRRRRRGRRGGRRNRREEGGDQPMGTGEQPPAMSEAATEQIAAAVLSQDAIAESVGLVPEPAPEQIDAVAAEPVAAETVADAPAEKPKRARRTRKSADAEQSVQDGTAEPAAAEVAGDADEKPARPKRTRKPRVAAPPTEEAALAAAEAVNLTTDQAAAEAAPSPEAPAPEPVAEEAPKRARKELPPEGIVVSSTALTESEAKPKKLGWWQRGFFGG